MGGQVGVDDLRGREPRWWRWLAFAVLLLGVVWRASAWLREPLLEFEDGAVLFARCFAEADPGRWFEPYGGYVPIGPNVTAWFACRLPIAAIPFAFVALAVALHAAAAASVLHPDWRSLGSFGQRLVVAASVAWLPVTDHLHFTTLSYVQWGMLWWLVVLMLRPPAGSTAARWRHGALVAALVVWHPLAITLAPLWFVRRAREGRREVWLCFVLSGVAYWVVRWFVVTEATDVDPARLGDLAYHWFVRVGVEAVAGTELRPWLLTAAGAWAVWLVAAVVWGAWAWLVVHALRGVAAAARWFAVGVLWLGFVSLAAGLLCRDELVADAYWPVRYYGPGRHAFVAVGVLALLRVASWRVAVPVIVAVTAAVTLAGAERYHRHAERSADVRAFVAELRRQEVERGGRRWIRARMRPKFGWPIVVRPR